MGDFEEAADHARSAHMPGDDQSRGAQQDLNRSLEREISLSVGEVLAAHDKRAGELRSDIAMVLREIDAGGTTLVTADSDGRARSWDVAFPAGLLAGACAIADQSLTRQRWAGYAGTQPFQQVCPAS